MNENNVNFTPDAPNFKTLVRMSFQGLTNFPYIEEDFDSLTNYGFLSKVVEYLNEVISNNNEQNDTITGLYNAYVSLQNYVNDYFGNLDVQEEINNKLDAMTESGELTQLIKNYVDPIYQAYENEINSQVTLINNKVDVIASGSPLVATSTSDMTDTTRVYVNTTDGKWYYYDGDSWEIGGTYQSTGIANDSIFPYMTTFLETKNLLPYTDWVEGKVYNNQGAEITYANGCLNRTEVIVSPSTTYIRVNNSDLTMTDMTVSEFNSSDEILKQTRIGYTLYPRLTTTENTAYVKFSSLTNKFSTLPTNSMYLLSLEDLSKLESYTSVFQFNKNSKQTIKSSDIFIENPYGFRLVPDIYRSGYNYNIANLKYTSVYTYTNILSITNATMIHGSYMYANNVTTNDFLYVDLTGSDDDATYITLGNRANQGFGYMTKVSPYKYAIQLTSDIIANLETGNLRCQVIYANQTSGTTKNVKASAYINYDFTNILNLVQSDSDKPIKFILLGDSITHLSGDRSWFGYFSELITNTLIANVAVDGAHLKDYEDTVYDGTPTDQLQANNVLGNQVQKIINSNYEAPDVIMIAIGTNGGIELEENDIKNAYLNGNVLKPLTNVDRTTDAGAFRYCNEKLHDLYPNAIIIWCCPIIANTLNKTTENVIKWGNNLKLLCDYGSNYCFDTANCGINMVNWEEYLQDGLHPNAAGAKLMGYYNAGEFEKVKLRFKK